MTTLRYALRRLAREWGYTSIHVVGLAVGLAACLLILLYLQHERSYDRFHSAPDRTVQLVRGSQVRHLPGHVGPDLAERLSSVEAAAAISAAWEPMLVRVDGEAADVEGFAYASPQFFDVFDGFTVLAGDPTAALHRPDGAVLTRSLAERLYGSAESALGRALETVDEEVLDGDALEEKGWMSFASRGAVPYTVRAVVDDPPTQSSVQFSLLVPALDTGFRGWNVSSTETFLRLRPGTGLDGFEDRLAEYVDAHAFMVGEGGASPVQDEVLRAQPLPEAHLRPDLDAPEGTGPRQYLLVFAAAALLILLIASANYVNLATARATQRAREVGVRKTVGASRAQLWGQFLLEAGVVVAAALTLGVGLAALALPWFSGLLGVELSLVSLATPLGAGVLLALFVVITAASGAFPAFVLSQFRPARVLKGAGAPGSGLWLRRGLVVFQFAASVGLVLAMLGVQRQMDFIRDARLDALDSEVVVVDNSAGALDARYDVFRQELAADPAVAHVTTGAAPTGSRFTTTSTLRDGADPTPVSVVFAGEGYVETLGLTVVAGTGLAGPHPPSVDTPVLVNETAVAASDLAGPEGAVGALDTPFNGGDVVGVVEDYHFEPFDTAIKPLVILPAEGAQGTVLVRLEAGRVAAGLAAVEAAWNRHVPDRPVRTAFLDEALDESYQAERRMGGLFRAFALLGIVVAAMGLFGLAAYTAELRAKEVGIRKVLGASVARLVGLLSRDFVVLVAVAFAVAAPLATVGLRRWLDGFVYRADPDVWLVAWAGGLVLLVALVAVGGQALRAATADPVRALRSE
jgi:putative ABC transport system permease protein